MTNMILDWVPRCFGQLLTAWREAELAGATLHLTWRCLGEPTRERPGMGSPCRPVGPTGGDRCRHDLGELRRGGAVDLPSETRCWAPDGSGCPTCPPPQPPVAVEPAYGQGALFEIGAVR